MTRNKRAKGILASIWYPSLLERGRGSNPRAGEGFIPFTECWAVCPVSKFKGLRNSGEGWALGPRLTSKPAELAHTVRALELESHVVGSYHERTAFRMGRTTSLDVTQARFECWKARPLWGERTWPRGRAHGGASRPFFGRNLMRARGLGARAQDPRKPGGAVLSGRRPGSDVPRSKCRHPPPARHEAAVAQQPPPRLCRDEPRPGSPRHSAERGHPHVPFCGSSAAFLVRQVLRVAGLPAS